MHVAHLRVRDFRNYARLDTDFTPGFHLLLGDNAQGKTNLLEAIYLLAALRSFRGATGPQLVRHGQSAYFVGCNVVGQGTHELKLYWSNTERKLSLDGEPVRRLADYLGFLQAVVFCTEDLQLVKGPASRRRRYLDLLLTQTQPGYLPVLQRYMRAVRSRNALLKQTLMDEAALDGFTREAVAAGENLVRWRRAVVPRLSPLVRLAYRRVARESEELRVDYRPNVERDLAVALAQCRSRERAQRTTLLGPHRDELLFYLDEKPAAVFASEGQKRTLAIALKMAQAEYLAGLTGCPPVLLIDDVMGELDSHRRGGLLPLLDRSHQAGGQVFLTCTEENWPRELGPHITRWHIQAGHMTRIGD